MDKLQKVEFDEANIEGMFYFDENQKTLYIEVEPSNSGFRGALEENDWLRTNFVAFSSPVGFLRYHTGFYIAWRKLENALREFIETIDADSVKHIYTFGHSLGGAVSGIAAYEARKYFVNAKDVRHWSFAGPRFLHGLRSRIIFSQQVKSTVFRYGVDVVTRVPFSIMRYWHASRPVHLKPDPRPLRFSNLWNDHYPERYLKSLGVSSFFQFVREERAEYSV